MASTYTQIYLHFVINVESKQNLIPNSQTENVSKYVAGIVQGFKYRHKMIRINCITNHLHMLVGFRPAQSISDFMREVKKASTKHINEQSWMKFRFSWMEGYGCFSVESNGLDGVCEYIDKQQEHHRKVSFDEEYRSILRKYDVVYDPSYFL